MKLMKNLKNGFSPEPERSSLKNGSLAEKEQETLRNEFEIMKKLDFVFIKELGAGTAEEYIMKMTTITYSPAERSDQEHMA